MLIGPRIAARTVSSEGPLDKGGKVFVDVVIVTERESLTGSPYLMVVVKLVWEQALMVPRDHHVSPVSPRNYHVLYPKRAQVMTVHDRRTRRG
jgi:hypothetical protein